MAKYNEINITPSYTVTGVKGEYTDHNFNIILSESDIRGNAWTAHFNRRTYRAVMDSSIASSEGAYFRCSVLQNGVVVQYADRYDGKYRANEEVICTTGINETPLLYLSGRMSLRVEDSNRVFQTVDFYKPNSITASFTPEVPKNITHVNNKIYENIEIVTEMTSSNDLVYELWQDHNLLQASKRVKGKTFTIPAGTIKINKSVTVKIRSVFTVNGVDYVSDEVEYNLSGLQGLEVAAPTNLRSAGANKYVEEAIPIAFDATTETGETFELEVWQDSINIHSKTINATSYNIPAFTLKNTNSINVKVRAKKSVNGYIAYSSYVNLNISNIKTLRPSLTNFSLNQSNKDYDITVIPVCTGASKYKVNGINGVTIVMGTLSAGYQNITLEAIALNSQGIEVSTSLTKEFDITRDEPRVYSLEPSGINIDVTRPSVVSFATNNFVRRWILYVNSLQYTSGTSERSISIPSNTFRNGINKITLYAEYYPDYNIQDIRSTSFTSQFEGYGKPNLPLIDNTSVYNTSNPVLTWVKDDSQTAYEIQVIDKQTGSIVENKSVSSATNSHTIQYALSNKKYYTVKLRLKNKYNIWSDWASKEFYTNFNSLPIPRLSTYNTPYTTTVSVYADSIYAFKEIRLYRKNDVEKEWVCIAYGLPIDAVVTDYAPRPNVNNYYKARLYDTSGGYSESQAYSNYFNMRHYHLSNAEDFEDFMLFKSAIASFSPVTSSVAKIFAGKSKPTLYKSNSKYFTGTIQYTATTDQVYDLESFISNANLLCYRDWRGRKLYCNIEITDISYTEDGLNTVTMTITEVDYSEDNMLAKTRSVMLNG